MLILIDAAFSGVSCYSIFVQCTLEFLFLRKSSDLKMSDSRLPPKPRQKRGQGIFRAHRGESSSSVSDEIVMNHENLFPQDQVYAVGTPTSSSRSTADDDNEFMVIQETTSESDFFSDIENVPEDQEYICDDVSDALKTVDFHFDDDSETDQHDNLNEFFYDADDEDVFEDFAPDEFNYDNQYEGNNDGRSYSELGYDADDEDSEAEDGNRHFNEAVQPIPEDDLPESTYLQWCLKYNRL